MATIAILRALALSESGNYRKTRALTLSKSGNYRKTRALARAWHEPRVENYRKTRGVEGTTGPFQLPRAGKPEAEASHGNTYIYIEICARCWELPPEVAYDVPTPDRAHPSMVPTLAFYDSFHSSIVPTLAFYDSFHFSIVPTLAFHDGFHSSIMPTLALVSTVR